MGNYASKNTIGWLIDEIKSRFFKVTGGTVTGATTFQSTVSIGNATLEYDSNKEALVIANELKETMRLNSTGNLVFYREPAGGDSYIIQFKDAVDNGDYYGHIDIVSPAADDTLNTRSIRLTSHSKNIPSGWTTKALNTLELGVDDNGTRTVYVSAPSAWRTAIDAANSSHNHSASNITSGTLPISRGGTGKTTAADARSALGAAAKGWTQLTSSTGTTATKIDITDYSEVMVIARYSTTYLSSVVLPKTFIASSAREIYLGGGWDEGGQRRCCASISTTSFAGVRCTIDGSIKTSSTNFYLYAR